MHFTRWKFGRLVSALALYGMACGAQGSVAAAGAPAAKKPGAAAYKDVLDAAAQVTPTAEQALLNGVALTGKRAVAVGQRGHILYSDDQGKKWSQATVPVTSDLTAVHFPVPDQGWAVGHDGVVLHTSDAGKGWAKQLDGRMAAQLMYDYYSGAKRGKSGPDGGVASELERLQAQGPDKPFLDVFFENASTGYVVGAFNLIFRTADGGRSWVPLFDRIDNPKRYHLYAIRGIGSEVYIAGEQGSLFRLDRQSGRFQAVKTPYRGTFFGITGNAGALILYGMRGNAFRSGDGGRSWQKIETGVHAGLTAGTALGDGRLLLVSQAGQILVSSDNGMTFRSTGANSVPGAGVAALDNGRVIVVGFGGARLVPIN